MRYQFTLSAYDHLDQIQVHAKLWDYDDPDREPGGECLLERSFSLAGVGETDPAHWLLPVLWELVERV